LVRASGMTVRSCIYSVNGRSAAVRYWRNSRDRVALRTASSRRRPNGENPTLAVFDCAMGSRMHSFSELIDRSTHFTLSTLKEVGDRVHEALQTSGATSLVKTLQMIQLQKVIVAVGMFSLFEAIIQDRLECEDGFAEARKLLDRSGERELEERFSNLLDAVNVLKHGRGKSYDRLLTKLDRLSFRVRRPDENFFFEGDVSEISALIDVDDGFIEGCAAVIRDVSYVIRPGVGL